MLFGDLCEKYNIPCKELFKYEEIPDEWGANDVSYEFDGENHVWKKNNDYESITFDGSNYLYRVKYPNTPRVFEEFISEKYGCYIT